MSETVQSRSTSDLENQLMPATVTSSDRMADVILRGLWIGVYDVLIRTFIVIRRVENRLSR